MFHGKLKGRPGKGKRKSLGSNTIFAGVQKVHIPVSYILGKIVLFIILLRKCFTEGKQTSPHQDRVAYSVGKHEVWVSSNTLQAPEESENYTTTRHTSVLVNANTSQA